MLKWEEPRVEGTGCQKCLIWEELWVESVIVGGATYKTRCMLKEFDAGEERHTESVGSGRSCMWVELKCGRN